MSWFKRKRTHPFVPSGWGGPDDPDTRTRDVVQHLSFEVTRLIGVTEQLQDLIETFDNKDKDTTNEPG